MAIDPESRDVIRNDEENFLDVDDLLWILTDARTWSSTAGSAAGAS